jgi:hypothetical protein
VHLPTCEVHRYHFEVPECTNQRLPEAHQICHTQQYQRLLRFTALHRLQRNNQSTTCVPHPLIVSDGERPRLCCLTLVSFRNCTCSSSLYNHHPPAARTTATSLHQPLRCTQRSGGWSGQQPSEAQQTGDCALWFALCCCAFPGASYPRFCSRHCDSGHPHVSITHLPTPAPVTRHLANHLSFACVEGTISSISFVKDVMVSDSVLAVSVQSTQNTFSSRLSPHLDGNDRH